MIPLPFSSSRNDHRLRERGRQSVSRGLGSGGDGGKRILHGEAAGTIIHVAERARVWVKTVSRVLNNAPNITRELKDRVLAAVEKLGASGGGAPGDPASAGPGPLATIAGDHRFSSSIQRVETLLAALAAAGIGAPNDWIYKGAFSFASGVAGANILLVERRVVSVRPVWRHQKQPIRVFLLMAVGPEGGRATLSRAWA